MRETSPPAAGQPVSQEGRGQREPGPAVPGCGVVETAPGGAGVGAGGVGNVPDSGSHASDPFPQTLKNVHTLEMKRLLLGSGSGMAGGWAQCVWGLERSLG